MKSYIGVLQLQAEFMLLGDYNNYRGWEMPENEDPNTKGFLVKFSDGRRTWWPEYVLESFFMAMEDPNSVSPKMVEELVSSVTAETIDKKTTFTKVQTKTGFIQYETSSCVDPVKYNETIGKEACLNKIKDRLWYALGFVLQWGKYGLKK